MSELEFVKKEIGGRLWGTQQLAPMAAVELEARLLLPLVSVAGPVFAAVGKSDEHEAAAISEAFRSAARAIPPKDFAALIVELCEMATVDGRAVVFDIEFKGATGIALRYQVAWFVLEANFKDFFSEMFPGFDLEKAKDLFGPAGAVPSTGESGAPS